MNLKKFKSNFSLNLMKTLENTFGNVYYKDVNQIFNENPKTNFVITNKNIIGYKEYISNQTANIYLDNKNTIELDLFEAK